MNNTFGDTFRAFNQIENFSYTKQQTEKIKSEIQGKSKEYILGVDSEEYINYFIDRYSLTELHVDLEDENISKPIKTKDWLEQRGRSFEIDIYTFEVYYPFTGSSILLRIKPSTWNMSSENISINESLKLVSFRFTLHKKDPELFRRTKQDIRRRAFSNLKNINGFVTTWNNSIRGIVSQSLSFEKRKHEEENDFFAAINIPIDKNTKSVFTAPTIKKKIVPQPKVNKNKEFSSEPTMAKAMYDDILKVIYDFGKSMEKKPSTYIGKDEEGLRDNLLVLLETRYDETTATGETFNRGGKTDIILKYANDASNLFVAECKFWHGSSEFLKAISQLFDRYLTWRDSKTSVILFVKNDDFSKVLNTIKTDIVNHKYYVKDNGKRGESSFSYIFHLPNDEGKEVFLEVIALHFDKKI